MGDWMHFFWTYIRWPFLTGSSRWDMIRQIMIFPSIEESWPDVIHCEHILNMADFKRFINKNANKVPLNMKQFLTIDPARRVSTNTLQTRYLNEDIIVQKCALSSQLKNQQLNSKMRLIVLDWISDITYVRKFSEVTFHTAVVISDSFLRIKEVARKRFQLVAVVSIMIASKLHEQDNLSIADCVYFCDSVYTQSDAVTTEKQICMSLNYEFMTLTCAEVLTTMNARPGAFFILSTRIYTMALLKMLKLLPKTCIISRVLWLQHQTWWINKRRRQKVH